MKAFLNKPFALILLTAYLYLAVVSLFVMTSHNHMGMTNCPYMIGQHSLCAMDAFEHIGAWKNISLSIPSIVFVLTTFLGGFMLSGFLLSSSPPIIRQLLYSKKLNFEPIFSHIDFQFSKGILNPKPY